MNNVNKEPEQKTNDKSKEPEQSINEKIGKIEQDIEKIENDVEHSWAWEMLRQVKSTTHKLWWAFFVTLGLLFATNFIWIIFLNQYDMLSTNTYEANGIYALIDADGNIIAKDISEEELAAFEKWWELHSGDNKDNENQN